MSGILEKITHKILDYDKFSAQFDKVPNELNEFGYDDWGMNSESVKTVLGILKWLYENYFRVEVHGIDKVPEGRLLFIANHGGQLPLDGALLFYAMAMHGNPPRILRAMVERLAARLPFVSSFMARCGQVTGDPVNCRKLLENEEAVMVFPEGVRGSGKLFWQRYQLQKFGTGFMRLALETNTPIIPVAIVGSEETYPAIYNFKILAKLFKLPYFPITPLWPFLGPIGMIPLPSKIHLHFGTPLWLDGDFDGPDAEIQQQVEVVQNCIKDLIKHGLKERGKKIF